MFEDFDAAGAKIEEWEALLSLLLNGAKVVLETVSEEQRQTLANTIIQRCRHCCARSSKRSPRMSTLAQDALGLASNFHHLLEKDLNGELDDGDKAALAALGPQLRCAEAWPGTVPPPPARSV